MTRSWSWRRNERNAPPTAFGLRTAVAILLALVAWYAAFSAWSLHFSAGPPAQSISIRWAPGVSAVERLRVERELRLTAGREREARTWDYSPSDRSSAAIARLVRHPLVEDTQHVDRQAFRIQLDRPDLGPWLRSLAETDQLPLIALVLALAGAIPIWMSKRDIRHGAEHAWTAMARRSGGYRHAEIVGGIALSVLFLLPLLIYGPYETEIVQATLFPNQVHYQALAKGQWLYWLDNLGFGTPLPIGDPLSYHPVFGPLSAFASLRLTLIALWLTHTIVATVYFLRLAAVSGVRPALRIVLLACYLCSVPFLIYFYQTDWVQHAVTWTLYPAMVWYLRLAITGEAVTKFWLTAMRLGFLFGFWIINGHPGHLAPLLVVLIAYTLVVAPVGSTPRRVYVCLAVSAVVCAAIASERLYFLTSEALRFPPEAPYPRGGFAVRDYVTAQLAYRVFEGRVPFLGLAMGVAAVASVLGLRRHQNANVRACAVAFATAAVLSCMPDSLRPVAKWLSPSGGLFFGDPMVLFGLMAGGAWLQDRLASPAPRTRRLAMLFLAVQVCQQGAVSASFLRVFLDHRDDLQFYRHQGHAVGLGRVLVENARRFGPRLYLSPQVSALMNGRLSKYGVHFPSDLVFLGLNPIQGWFKNVSMDQVYPSLSLMEGVIIGDENVLHNHTLLDVLGINLVLTTESEGAIPAGLSVVNRMKADDRGTLVTLANPDAWPRAVFMDPDAFEVSLPLNPGCLHRGALCRDYKPLFGKRLEGAVALVSTNGRHVATFAPSDRERLLFLSVLYRPEWNVVGPTDSRLHIHRVANAFLGVTVPPGVGEVRIAFTPGLHMALTGLGGLALLATGSMLSILWFNGRQRR